MKIKYQFVNGKTVELEVTEEWASIMIDLDRQEYNVNHKETRRHCSLDALNQHESFFASDENTEDIVLQNIEAKRLSEAIQTLTPRQRELIEKVFFQGRTYADIAREEHKSPSTIRESMSYALKKLKKFLS